MFRKIRLQDFYSRNLLTEVTLDFLLLYHRAALYIVSEFPLLQFFYNGIREISPLVLFSVFRD